MNFEKYLNNENTSILWKVDETNTLQKLKSKGVFESSSMPSGSIPIEQQMMNWIQKNILIKKSISSTTSTLSTSQTSSSQISSSQISSSQRSPSQISSSQRSPSQISSSSTSQKTSETGKLINSLNNNNNNNNNQVAEEIKELKDSKCYTNPEYINKNKEMAKWSYNKDQLIEYDLVDKTCSEKKSKSNCNNYRYKNKQVCLWDDTDLIWSATGNIKPNTTTPNTTTSTTTTTTTTTTQKTPVTTQNVNKPVSTQIPTLPPFIPSASNLFPNDLSFSQQPQQLQQEPNNYYINVQVDANNNTIKNNNQSPGIDTSTPYSPPPVQEYEPILPKTTTTSTSTLLNSQQKLSSLTDRYDYTMVNECDWNIPREYSENVKVCSNNYVYNLKPSPSLSSGVPVDAFEYQKYGNKIKN